MMTLMLNGSTDWGSVLIALAIALGVAAVLSEVAAAITRRILGNTSRTDAAADPSVKLVRTVRQVVFLLAALLAVVPALRSTGIDTGNIGLHPRAIASWLFGPGLRAVLIAGAGYVITRIIGVVVGRLEDRIGSGANDLERRKRARTLGNLVRNVAAAVIGTIAILMLLRELDMDIAPVLTGAGVIGLAVGFGAQTLVRDIISGFFLILEDQVRVGDTVVINATAGVVEQINLRTIVLRDAEGTVHVFPNGAVTTLANRTRDFAYAVVNVGISYTEDVDRVIDILKEIAVELSADPHLHPLIMERMEILGVESLGDSQVTIQVRIKTLPLHQAEVGRGLRRLIKRAFDERGIQIPYRQVVMQATPGRAPAPDP